MISARPKCLKTFEVSMNKEHDGDKMSNYSCPSQLASSSNSLDQLLSLPIAVHELVDGVAEVSESVHFVLEQPSEPTSSANQQLDTMCVPSGEEYIVAPADQTATCESSCSSSDSVDGRPTREVTNEIKLVSTTLSLVDQETDLSPCV